MSDTRQERIRAMRISAILGPSAEQLEDMKAELRALWAREKLLDDVVIEHRVWADNKGWPSPTLAALTAHDSEQGG